MSDFQFNCPHCLTAQAGFSARYQWQGAEGGNRGNLLGVCGVCDRGVVFSVEARGWSSFPNMLDRQYRMSDNQFVILRSWPELPVIIPENVPDPVGGYFEQGIRSLRAQNWDAAGSMFRKTLDVATKQLRPDLKTKSLFDRINQMVVDHDLTPAMGEWSHRIRLDGNSAVHDEDPETEEDAVGTRDFTEAFLTYAFALPARVAAHTQKPANDAQAVA